MNQSEIVMQFEERSKSAGRYREFSALLLVVSVILFILYGINRSQIGVWGGVMLATGIVLMVVAFALVLLSFMNVRCPNCGRILGEVYGAAFCPSCGVALKSDAPPVPGSAGALARRAGAKQAKRRGSALSKRGRDWEPRSGFPGIEEYPEEAYPKNIRMFTTPDEMELTKRYIHLIERDNQKQLTQGERGILQGGSNAKPAGLPRPASRPKRRSPKGRPSWRRIRRVSPEEETLGWFARLLLRIRR